MSVVFVDLRNTFIDFDPSDLIANVDKLALSDATPNDKAASKVQRTPDIIEGAVVLVDSVLQVTNPCYLLLFSFIFFNRRLLMGSRCHQFMLRNFSCNFLNY